MSLVPNIGNFKYSGRGLEYNTSLHGLELFVGNFVGKFFGSSISLPFLGALVRYIKVTFSPFHKIESPKEIWTTNKWKVHN